MGDLRAVRELLSHADVATTQVYPHLDFQHLSQGLRRDPPAGRPNAWRERRAPEPGPSPDGPRLASGEGVGLAAAMHATYLPSPDQCDRPSLTRSPLLSLLTRAGVDRLAIGGEGPVLDQDLVSCRRRGGRASPS